MGIPERPRVSSVALLHLVVGPHAPREARAAVLARIPDLADYGVSETLDLLASELVAQCMTAGARPGEMLQLRVHRSPRVVRLDVSDPGSDLPTGTSAITHPGDDRTLRAIDALRTRWGARGDAEANVWAEVESASA